jgi:hypothetical protein
MILDLLTWHPPSPVTEAKWRRLGTRPILTVAVDGLRHTISLDVGVRDGRVSTFDSDTGNRVYVVGHEGLSDPLDVALETPVHRYPHRPYPGAPPNYVDPDDGVVSPPSHTFGTRYEVDQVDLDVGDEDSWHVSGDGVRYDLNSGYGPAWVRGAMPPIEAVAGLIAYFLHSAASDGAVTIIDHGDHSVIEAGSLTVKVPPLRFGPSAERITAIVSRLTREKFEVTFLEDPTHAAYALGHNSAGFWAWFARAAMSAGLRALQVSEREPDTLYLMLDKRCCSGDDGPSWGCGSEPMVP